MNATPRSDGDVVAMAKPPVDAVAAPSMRAAAAAPRLVSMRALSLRLPLIGATLVVLTALLMAGGLGVLTKRYLIEDVDAGAFQAMAAWSKNLPTLVQQDNVWAVYETLTAVTGDRVASPPHSASLAVVLGPDGRVFASSDPSLFPTARAPTWTPLWAPDSLQISVPLSVGSTHPGLSPPIQSGNWRIYLSALRSDSGARAGTLVYAVSDSLYRQRLKSMSWWITGITLLAIAVFGPVVWILTRRVLAPLERLRGSMENHDGSARRIGVELARRHDEVGTLAAAFLRLLEQAERARRAERLAAVGALAAATAHEINNPLGGMLNALHTAKRFGKYDDITRQTLDLLDRGLEQLRVTSQALLAQSRPEERDLIRQDFTDLAEIIGPCRHDRGVGLESRIDLPATPVPVAAGPVRQATLNMLLNACHAAVPHSALQLDVGVANDLLRVRVRNVGSAPPASLMADIAPSTVPDGPGFGLWESRRLLGDIGGALELSHLAGVTTALIEIPLRR